jgi:GMP synthase PP-ATPase subunit
LIVDFQTATIWNVIVNKMILLTNDAVKTIGMLKRNYGRSEKIVEQLLKEAKAKKPVTYSNDFQEFSNLVENLSVTVEYQYQYLIQVRTHDVNIQQFADWVSTQNEIVSKVVSAVILYRPL